MNQSCNWAQSQQLERPAAGYAAVEVGAAAVGHGVVAVAFPGENDAGCGNALAFVAEFVASCEMFVIEQRLRHTARRLAKL